MERKQFTFYRSFLDGVVKMQEEDQLKALLSVIHYGLDGVLPEELNGHQATYFIMAKPNLDASWEKARAGAVGGKVSKRGPSKKISKGKKEKKKEKKIKTETESEGEGEGFARFWERYPLKLGEDQAQSQWESVCEEFSERDILDGLEAWRNSEFWKREGGRFIPKPDKWLSERWWLQNPKQVTPRGVYGELGKAEVEAIQQLFERS